MNTALWIFTAAALIFSYIKSKDKTQKAMKIALKKFANVMSLFLIVLAGFSIIITFLSPEFIQKYIGTESGLRGIAVSLGLGSISLLPGFAAFPLCAALRSEGIPYYIIAAFSLSVMNVGILTFPIEKKFIGLPAALLRNFLALGMCLITIVIVRMVFAD